MNEHTDYGPDCQLPQEIEAERSIMATAIVDPSTAPIIAEMLSPEDMYATDHQHIMAAIFALMLDGRPTDLATLMEELQAAGHMGNGMGAYLGKLMDWPAAADIDAAAARIKRAAARRAIITAADRMAQAAYDGSDIDDIRHLTQEAFSSVELALDQSSDLTKSPWDNPVDLSALIDTDPAPIEWFGKNRMPAGRGVLLNGVGGSSKTTLLKQMAAGAVLGKVAWDWEICKTGRAVLVLTEDTADDVHRSIHYTSNGLGLSLHDRQQVAAGLVIHAMAGKECILLKRDATGAMIETHLFHSLEKKIKSLGDVVFIGIDPALSVTTGDELDQGHQRALGRMVDNLAVRTGALVCLVAHATKASLNREELDSHNSRGGGAITDAVRAEYSMRTMTAIEAKRAGIDDLEERKRHVQLVATKGNALPPDAFVPVWLRRDTTGTLSQVEIVLGEGGREPGKKDMEALDVLRTMAATATPTLKEWRAECVEQGIVKAKTADAQEKAMQRIIKKLSGAEMIHQGVGKGVWLPGGQG